MIDLIVNDLQLIRLARSYVEVYLSVTATDGIRSLTEEFHIGRQIVGRQIVTDARGWPRRSDGVFIDPSRLTPDRPEPTWTWEVVPIDLRAEIRAVVIRTLRSKLSRGAAQDRPDTLRSRILSKWLSFDDVRKLPVEVQTLVGSRETA